MQINLQGMRNFKGEAPPRPFVQRCLNSGEKTRGERNRLYVKGSFANLMEKQAIAEKENAFQKMTSVGNANSNRNLATFRPDPDKILSENSGNHSRLNFESRGDAEVKTGCKNKSFSRDPNEYEGEEDVEIVIRPLNLSSCEGRPSLTGKAEVKTRRREPISPLEERMNSMQSEETSTKRDRHNKLIKMDFKASNEKRSSSAVGNSSRSLMHSIYQNTLEDCQNERFVDKKKKIMLSELRDIEKKLLSVKETEDDIFRRESQIIDEKRFLLGKHAKLEKRFLEMKSILGDVTSNRNSRSSRDLLSDASVLQDSDCEGVNLGALNKKRLQLQLLDQEIVQRREELQALENKLQFIKSDFDQKESVYLDRLFKLTTRIKNLESSFEDNRARDEALTEKEKMLEKREKELKIFVKKLEQQSEDVIAQKIEYQLKQETYNKMLRRLTEEGAEKNELYSAGPEEQEKFKKLEEQAILKLRNLESKQKALDEERKLSESKLRELVRREGELADRELQYQEKVNDLRKSQENRGEKPARDIALENHLQEKIAEIKLLKERLQTFEKDESFELKMMGLKMNEDLQKRKIEMEVKSLKEEWEKIREKEANLVRREINLEKRSSELNTAERSEDPGNNRRASITPGRLLGGRKSARLDTSVDSCKGKS